MVDERLDPFHHLCYVTKANPDTIWEYDRSYKQTLTKTVCNTWNASIFLTVFPGKEVTQMGTFSLNFYKFGDNPHLLDNILK